MGNSHVRRIGAFGDLLHTKLNRGEVSVSFSHRGGAGLNFVINNLEQARGFDILVIMAGGNDLTRGAKIPYFQQTYDTIEETARELGVQQVIITSFWPRRAPSYNQMAREHHEYFEDHFIVNGLMTFWSWDRRQSFRTFDGVHLEQKGYQKAIKYLIAPILWAIKHLEREG